MNKRYIIGAVVVVALVGLGFLIKGGKFTMSDGEPQSATQSTPDQAGKIIVDYTNSSYSPNVVRIRVGDTVTFVNGSTHPMWTASDPHPIHSAFVDFDAKKGYAPGESYSFTFTKEGSWSYHNHLSPGDTGKVVVENR